MYTNLKLKIFIEVWVSRATMLLQSPCDTSNYSISLEVKKMYIKVHITKGLSWLL